MKKRRINWLALIFSSLLLLLGIISNPESVLADSIPSPPNSESVDITEFFTNIGDSKTSGTYSNVVEISQDQLYQYGGIWYNHQIDLVEDFQMEMYVYLGDKRQSWGGADGISFVFHNDPRGLGALGSKGAGLGAFASKRDDLPPLSPTDPDYISYIQNAWMIEFDTFHNGEQEAGDSLLEYMDDPDETYDAGHIAWRIPKSVTGATADGHNDLQWSSSIPLTDNQWHRVYVVWDATAKKLTYQFGTDEDGDKFSPVTVYLDPMTVFGSTKIWWGFTGSTGVSTNYQAVAITQLPYDPLMHIEKSVRNITHTEFGPTHATTTGAIVDDIVEYKIEITNDTGSLKNIDASSVLTDKLESNTEYLPGSMYIDGGPVTPSITIDGSRQVLTTTLPRTIKPGETLVCAFYAKVKNDSINPILNMAEIEDSVHHVTASSNTTQIEIINAQILKKGKETDQPLAGAKYSIVDSGGQEVATGTTNSQGILNLSLPPGTYTVTEVAAPSGYLLATPASQTFTVTTNGGVEKVTFINALERSAIKITKVDSEDNQIKLAGAVFDVATDSAGSTIIYSGLVTDSNGELIIPNLVLGTYYIKETQAPFGYHIKDTDWIKVKVESNVVNHYTIENIPVRIHVRQAVLSENEDLVVPQTAYYLLDKMDTSNGVLTNQQLLSQSSIKDSSYEITNSLFNNYRIDGDKKIWQLTDIIPEYYQFVHAVVTSDATNLGDRHVSTNTNPAEVQNSQPIALDYSQSDEYWITIFIKPKMGEDSNDQIESAPRFYSWDELTNEFGKINQ